MKTLNKIAIACTAVASLGLVACQSNAQNQQSPQTIKQHGGHHAHHDKRGMKHDKQPRMTEEQRKAFETQVQQACAGKIGQTVNFTVDNKTMQGTCAVKFKPNDKDAKKSLFGDKDKHDKTMKHPKQMTEAERAEHDKKRTAMQQQRQAFNTQVQNACANKVGQTTSITLNGKTIEGTCQVMIQPDKDKQNMKHPRPMPEKK